MQFGRKLLEEEGAAPKEYRQSFIKYKTLKKLLKHRRLLTLQAGCKEGVEAEKAFLRLLRTQLKEVDRCVQDRKTLRVELADLYSIILVASDRFDQFPSICHSCRCFERESQKVLSMFNYQTASIKCIAQLAAVLTCRPEAGRQKVIHPSFGYSMWGIT